MGLALGTGALALPTGGAQGPAKKPPEKVKPNAAVPGRKNPMLATLEPLPQPDYLSDEARATLRRRMERHGEDMVQLFLAMTLLQHDVAAKAADRIAAEPTLDKPQPGAEDELGKVLPERFFTLQMQLRSRAKTIATEARAGDDAKLAASFGQLAETCVQCHTVYLHPPPR